MWTLSVPATTQVKTGNGPTIVVPFEIGEIRLQVHALICDKNTFCQTSSG